jgi:hypothetical protein
MNPSDDQLRTAMATVVDLILPDYICRRTATQAGARLACLAWLVEAPCMAGETQTRLASKLGLTRAMISKTVLALSRATGYRRPGQKPRRSSPRYSAGARRGWAARRENDRRVQTALAAAADYPPGVVWLNLLPKHLRRQVLVLIGTLPTATAMRHAAARGAHHGWCKLSQVSMHVAEVIERHSVPPQEGLLRLGTGENKESLQVVEREEPATGTKCEQI